MSTRLTKTARSVPSARSGLLAAAIGLTILAPHPALAQPAPDPSTVDTSPYDNRPIGSVRFRALPSETNRSAELSEYALQQASNNIRSARGTIFDSAVVNADMRRLNPLGLFTKVELAVGINTSGMVDVVFELAERALVSDVQVTGNTRINDAELAGVVDVFSGTPIDRFQIDRSARRIEELYRQKGFYYARVSVDETELADSGAVLFRILEGDRLKITAIRFEGNTSFSTRQLRRELETKQANIFRKGQLDDEKLSTDLANIITFYKDRGYLDIRADRLIQPAPNGKEAIVTYLVEEGPLYTLRSVQVDIQSEPGARAVYNQPQIAGLMSIHAGDVYSVRELDASIKAVQNAYGQMGYADAEVLRVEKRDPTDPLVDLIVIITEGVKYSVGEVIIQGNDLTRQEVIRRQIELRPTRPLDTTAMDRSKILLRRTTLFNERTGAKVTPQAPGVEFYAEVWDTPPDASPLPRVTLAPPDLNRTRDVLVEIEETNTGRFDVGGAVSSDSGVVGRISLIQRNFDIRDTPDSTGDFFSGRSFRGGGQTFSIEVLPGNRVQTYSIGLTEPYLFESNYSGSASLSIRNRDFDEFNEDRKGARLAIGRRFGTRWTGNIALRVEQVSLSDIEPSRPTDIFAVANESTLIGLSGNLERNTLDNRIRPTKGSKTNLRLEQVVGDFEFTKIEAQHGFYVPIREDYLGRATVLSVNTSLGYIPQGRADTPTYERFYLGGQDFRGFQFRTISPKGIRNDNNMPSNDPVGGTWKFYLGAQIEQPVYEDILSIVGFVDTGTVTFDPGFDDYRVSVGFGFRFHIPTLSPAPLAFDFGFPIMKQDDDESRLFTFTVDLPF
ncbi:MAG: BamA/TamA family outer membrane protein [Phycisphaerales bacterium]|nr:BamA/TamA family outer membrane protein [Phycisphaerales bacterium]